MARDNLTEALSRCRHIKAAAADLEYFLEQLGRDEEADTAAAICDDATALLTALETPGGG